MMKKLQYLLMIVLLTMVLGNLNLLTAWAEPIVINKSKINTSEMETGKDYRLHMDTIITIDKSVSIRYLETANYSLIIQGSDNATLEMVGMSSNTGGTSKPVQMKSGNVKVKSELSTLDSYNAVYTSGLFRMDGGNLTINVYRTGAIRPVNGLCVKAFIMTNGTLKINAGTGDSVSAYGMDIYGNNSESFIYGGSLVIDSEDVGMSLNDDTALSISGGTVNISSGAGTGKGWSLKPGKKPVKISGGNVTLRGGMAGFYTGSLEISGNETRVTASGKDYGIYGEKVTVKGHSVLIAEGGKYAIMASEDTGIDFDESILSIQQPVGGYIDNAGWGKVVYDSYGNIAKKVIIDYEDQVDGIQVMLDPEKVTKGKESTVKCSAAVIGYTHGQEFFWSVSGAKSLGTAISTDGTLTVPADETADKLIIRAAYKADTSKTGEKGLILKDPPKIPVISGETTLPPSVPAEDAAVILDPSVSEEVSEKGVTAIPTNASLAAVPETEISTAANFSKKTMTIRYSAVSGASNYIIAWKKAKSGKWKYFTTGGKTKYVIRKLKRKELLEFKVAAFADGKLGPWSGINRRYFEIAKGTAERNGSDLTLKLQPVKGATGYQLVYATNKNLKNSKTKTVGKKTAITIHNLKQQKTYYVKWRPIKKYKGNRYYGILSARKKF